MKVFYNSIKDAVRYGLADKLAILVIGGIMFLTALDHRFFDIPFHYSSILMLIVVGYGSFISWYAINGQDKHPRLNNIKKMAWEGFKKSCIIVAYSIFLTYVGHYGKEFLSSGNYLFGIILTVLFLLTYLMLIGGLFNRYLNNGKFLKAFDLVEIIKLLLSFDTRNFIRVLIAVVISQTFTVSVFIKIIPEIPSLELLLTFAFFFLAPFLYMANKRLVGLQVRNLLH